ncbi:hypothetical protein T281_16100 [Rhodomicrobium udaipurense JA643]|uniref:Uncharacterized protein n=1 Tax=Rhodomicrobium udaipurense TaxID=1202716 RepID=A0A8I1GH14_9HYPH|nr:hypothetical protein [Rhodomicrobium udaipurense]KAI93534.1 hypothetical protein T281_16100 [Rhodomicrobium udaipurense JA643]MBJ7543230.1 hypothetical protein [Rhodomicrobium udaipurense]
MMLTRLIWRARAAYWFRRLTGMQRVDAWRYAGTFTEDADFWETFRSESPRETVEYEMTCWGDY